MMNWGHHQLVHGVMGIHKIVWLVKRHIQSIVIIIEVMVHMGLALLTRLHHELFLGSLLLWDNVGNIVSIKADRAKELVGECGSLIASSWALNPS